MLKSSTDRFDEMNHKQLQLSLLNKQGLLRKRLAAINTDLKCSHSRDWEEQAQERENDEVLEALAKDAANDLNSITIALQKLENNCYGICSHCGETISPQRLAALPYTDRCIYCASE